MTAEAEKFTGKITVELRGYKGGEILRGENGKIKNENQSLTFTYNDLQWKNHLANLPKMGFCKLEVENYYEGETKSECPQNIIDEVEAVLKVKEAELSPEQKEIKELREKLDLVLAGQGGAAKTEAKQTKTDAPKESKTEADAELKAAREEYEKIVGKKGGPSWDTATIKQKIEEFKNQK